MADRPFREKLADIESHPEDWEEVSVHTDKATRRRSRQSGISIQKVYRHKATGETIVRHILTNNRGRVVSDHFREDYKARSGDV